MSGKLKSIFLPKKMYYGDRAVSNLAERGSKFRIRFGTESTDVRRGR